MDMKKLKRMVRERLLLAQGRFSNRNPTSQELNELMEDVFVLLEEEGTFIPGQLKKQLSSEVIADLLGWGPLQPLMEDEEVTEIMVNGPYKVYVEKNGKSILTDIKFDDEHHLRYLIERMLLPTGRRIDESYPYVDFSLEDGSRVNVIIPPLAYTGTTVTIRKFSHSLEDIENLIRLGTLERRMADFLIACVRAKLNIVFSGATGAGKTTTLGIISSYIDPKERIITIEDALEITLRQEHVVRLLTKPPNVEGKGEITTRELFINSLRMRPARIILGEIRGAEALDFLQALNSGHRGSLAVLHASSPEDVILRLETMALYSGMSLPNWVIRSQIARGVDVIVQHEQLIDGSRKITHISEVEPDEKKGVRVKDLFLFEVESITPEGKVIGRFKPTGVLPSFLKEFKRRGVSLSEDIFKE